MPTDNEIISLENDVVGHSSKDCNTIKSYSSLLQQLYLDSFSLDRELILLTVSPRLLRLHQPSSGNTVAIKVYVGYSEGTVDDM